jgi:hypothetical protein
MPFRYRHTTRFGPLRLNLTTHGLSSVSLRILGVSLNKGRRGVRATVHVPGTGMSYSTRPGCLGLGRKESE